MRIAEDPDWPPGRLHLTDLSTVGTAAIPDTQLVELLYEGTNLGEELKLAVVVRDEFAAGGDVRFASGLKQLEGAVFANLNAACEYLGVDTQTVREITGELRTELDERSDT